MKKYKKNKVLILLVIVILGLSLGYALLTQDLTINGITKVKGNTWDIHFDNVQISSGSVSLSEGDSAASIDANDSTLINYMITLNKPGDFYEFTVNVVNAGTVDGMIGEISSKLNETVIDSTNPLPAYLDYTVTYYDGIALAPNHLLKAGDTETFKVRVEFKRDIDESILPTTSQTHSFSFRANYIQANNDAIPIRDMLMQQDDDSNTTFGKSISRSSFESIITVSSNTVPNNAIDSWDVSNNQNGSVMAWYLDQDNDNKYELYIGQNGGVLANTDSSYAFANFRNIDILNIDNLNTIYVEDMNNMFNYTGYNSRSFVLDLGNTFYTNRVTNMERMFYYTAHLSTVFTLNLGDNFDTSNVINMKGLFQETASSSKVMKLDLGDKFNTSKVEKMDAMFMDTAYESTVFTIDFGEQFDTSNVKSMNHMFWNTGVRSTIFTLNFGDKFNTSKVTNMTYMFYYTGYANSSFVLDLTSYDFSNVTSYDNMFYGLRSSIRIWVKDANDQAWVIARRSDFSTSNVLIKNS